MDEYTMILTNPVSMGTPLMSFPDRMRFVESIKNGSPVVLDEGMTLTRLTRSTLGVWDEGRCP